MEKQNNEKLSDKAFARLFLTSILGILVCIICLCSTTYAWFTGSVQVDSNKIQTADACLISVSVYKDGADSNIHASSNTSVKKVKYLFYRPFTNKNGYPDGYPFLFIEAKL